MVPVALLLVATLAQPAAVDTRRLLGQSEQTAKRLAEAERTLAAGKATDALEQVLRVQDEAGDDLVSADGRHYRSARRTAQQILVKLPPPVLRIYRDRVAGPADALLAAGTRDRDPRPLRTLLDRYFPAAAAEPALMVLGELLFERGEFRAAERCWRRLLPSSDPTADPSVPDPTTDPARVRALVALAAIFGGETDRARAEVLALRKEHPAAKGKLAGVDGMYADTVQRVLASRPRRPPPTGDGDWTAFAGGPARDGRANGRLPRYWPSRATWQTRLPSDGDRPAVAPTPTARSVAYHPVVLNGVGYVADPLRVFAFDPRTGAATLAYDLRREPGFQALPIDPGRSAPTADADFTLTAAGGRLYGRFGLYPSAVVPDPTARPNDFLVCLTPTAGRAELAIRWQVSPPARDGAVVVWEAAPVVAAGRVFAAFTRLDGTTRTFAVAAYADPPGDKPLWVTEVATAPAGTGPRVRQEPLTLAGDKLVYCTHAGSAVALDPQTGKPAWAVRYPDPRRKLAEPGPARDLQPPLAACGRVFVAPTDSDVLLALDAETGRQLWAADGLLTDQLLGVSRGRLVATLAGPQRGIRGFDSATGDDLGPGGWRQHDDPQLGSFGRGLVTDDLILWPTKQGLFPLDPETGTLVSQPLPGTHGNLSFADGVLLVGTPTGVAGFVPDRLRPDGSPRSRAVALADAGRVEEAVSVVDAANLPDAARLAAWWRPPPERPAAVGRPLVAPSPPDLPTRFDPAALTTIGPEVTVGGVTRFSSPVVPLRPFADGPALPGLSDRDPLLLVTDGPRVLAYRPGASTPTWATNLPEGVTVTRAITLAGDVIAAGPGAAVRLDRGNGRLVWAFTPPPAPGVGPRWASPPLPPVLADFTLAGTRLCCRSGGHTLLGIDLADGRLAWARDGHFLRYDPFPVQSAPGFTHLACPDGRRLLARRSDGKLLLLDPAGGDVLGVVPTAAVPWDGPPVWLGGKWAAVADGPDRVTALDLDKCLAAWTAGVGGDSASLWGKPPQLRPVGGGLVIATARTHGTELGFVRRTDGGQPTGWPDEPVFLSSGSVDLSAADADADTLFIPGERELTAFRLIDGGVAWRTPLPGPGRWRVRCGSRAVVLVTDSAVPREPVAGVIGRLSRRFLRHPHADRLPVLLLGLYDTWAGRTVPVVRLDPATGRTLGRLDLPAAGPACGVHLGPGPAVVATATAAYWLN